MNATIATTITRIDDARQVLAQVGEPYQQLTSDKLRAITYCQAHSDDETLAHRMVDILEETFVLHEANALYAKHRDRLDPNLRYRIEKHHADTQTAKEQTGDASHI